MPSISTAKVDINFEPISGDITITPSEGDSLDTVFTIKAVNFIDEDTPFTYRFYYYNGESLYDLERELGVNPVSSQRDFLSDTQYQNELLITLPHGRVDTDPNKSMKVLIMASVIDSLGAVTNSTIAVKVETKYSNLGDQVSHYQQFYQNNIQS